MMFTLLDLLVFGVLSFVVGTYFGLYIIPDIVRWLKGR